MSFDTSLIISLIALIWSLIYIFIKPRLDVNLTCLYNDALSIKIKNKGRSSAINLKIEACILDCNGDTYHLKIDKSGFVILPSTADKNHRTFKTTGFSKSALKYISSKDTVEDMIKKHCKVRVRIHSEHGFTGFGKAIEQNFEYCNNTKKFNKIK